MKKLILLLTLTFSVSALSQDREVKSKPDISTETISELNESTGWVLNRDEEWISLENTIPTSTLGSKYKSLYDYEKYGIGCDNFNFFKLKEITFKDSVYYILLKQYKSGYYKYKSIEEDWRNRTSHAAYIFTKSELSKLDSINDSQINLIEIALIAQINISYTTELEAIDLIQTKIDLSKPNRAKSNLILHIAPYKEKNIVQFQIYTTTGEYNIISGNNRENAKYVKQHYLKDDLFKNFYYETDYSNFNNFLNIQATKP